MERFDVETTMQRQIWLLEQLEQRSWVFDIGTEDHTQILADIRKVENWDAEDDAEKINKLYKNWR